MNKFKSSDKPKCRLGLFIHFQLEKVNHPSKHEKSRRRGEILARIVSVLRRLQWDANPWSLRRRCNALPTVHLYSSPLPATWILCHSMLNSSSNRPIKKVTIYKVISLVTRKRNYPGIHWRKCFAKETVRIQSKWIPESPFFVFKSLRLPSWMILTC